MKLKKSIGFLVLVFMMLIPAPMMIFAAEGQTNSNTWEIKASMSVNRAYFQTEVIDGKIYVIGGFSGTKVLNTVEAYDPRENKWTQLAPMSVARHFFRTEVINGKIYAIGGATKVNDNNASTTSIEVYDPSTNKWTLLAPMSTGRFKLQTEVINGKIYALGGVASPFESNIVEVYDPSTNKWSTLSPMSKARAEFQTEVINGKIYAMGVYGYDNTVEVYDPSTDKWKTLAPMTYIDTNKGKCEFEAEVINGEIYVIGGRIDGQGNAAINAVEVYDPSMNKWTLLSSMPQPKNYFRTKLIDGKIYAVGGKSIGAYVYDPDTNRWKSLGQLSVARYGLQLEEIDGTIYALGGFANDYLDSIEAYTLQEYKLGPTNLTAIPGVAKIDLKWDAVEGTESYNIKRSETAGGPYTTISSVTGSAITLTDSNVENGKTYYYVVSAVKSNTESNNSNEASATLKVPDKILKLVLEVKQTKQLSVSEESSDNADMIWASSDTAIASVDDNGKVKAIKPGNTVITCTSKDGEYMETINVLVVNLDLQLAVDLSVGEKCRLTVDDLKNTTKVTWTADDPTIATVTSKGKVTAVSEGLTYITAMDEQGKEIGRIYIRVRE